MKNLLAILLIIIIGVFIALNAKKTSASQNVICDRCGKAITGRYVQYSLDGNKKLTVCQDCDRKLPHCASCRLPFNPKELTKHKGERLCKDCLAKATFCTLCGKRISGKFFQSKDGSEHYCTRCYYSYPRCAVCDRPGSLHRLSNGKGVCADCLPKLPRCGACGEPVVGTYYKFDSSDEVFCESCKLKAHKCYSCGVPLGKKHWLFDDGRRICNNCNDRAVYDIDRIKAIMADVENICTRQLGLGVKTPYDLQVKDLNNKSASLALKAKEGKNGDSPLFGKELGLYRRMNGKSEIFLLYGLPIEMLYDTAAHEFAHAWQAENCPRDQTPELLEGFAQWVSSQILQIKGYQKALERLEDRTDNPYGTGYQKVKRLELRLGRKGFMDYVKTARK